MKPTRSDRFSVKLLALALVLLMGAPAGALANSPSNLPAAPSPADPPTAEEIAQFKADMKKHLEELDESADILYESEFGKDMLDSAGLDPKGAVKAALDEMPNLTDNDVKFLKGAFEKNHPKWKETGGKVKGMFSEGLRNRLKGLPAKPKRQRNNQNVSFKAFGADNTLAAFAYGKGARGKFSLDKYSTNLTAFAKSYATLSVMPAVDPATCDPGPGTPLGITDVYIAKAAALALAAIMEGFPTDGLTIAARIGPIAAWAVAEGVVLVLEGLNAVEAECGDAKFQDDAINKLNALQTTANNIIANDNLNKDTIVGKVEAGTATVTAAIGTTKTEIIANADSNTQAVMTNANANKEELKALLLRTEIEADLAQAEGLTPVAIYELPNAHGGYLNLVRTIVADTITKIKAAGASVGLAATFLTQADTAKAAGNFKVAYNLYRKAYRTAAK